MPTVSLRPNAIHHLRGKYTQTHTEEKQQQLPSSMLLDRGEWLTHNIKKTTTITIIKTITILMNIYIFINEMTHWSDENKNNNKNKIYNNIDIFICINTVNIRVQIQLLYIELIEINIWDFHINTHNKFMDNKVIINGFYIDNTCKIIYLIEYTYISAMDVNELPDMDINDSSSSSSDNTNNNWWDTFMSTANDAKTLLSNNPITANDDIDDDNDIDVIEEPNKPITTNDNDDYTYNREDRLESVDRLLALGEDSITNNIINSNNKITTKTPYTTAMTANSPYTTATTANPPYTTATTANPPYTTATTANYTATTKSITPVPFSLPINNINNINVSAITTATHSPIRCMYIIQDKICAKEYTPNPTSDPNVLPTTNTPTTINYRCIIQYEYIKWNELKKYKSQFIPILDIYKDYIGIVIIINPNLYHFLIYSYDILSRKTSDIIYNQNENWNEILTEINMNNNMIHTIYEQELSETEWNQNTKQIIFKYAIGNTLHLEYHTFRSQQLYTMDLIEEKNSISISTSTSTPTSKPISTGKITSSTSTTNKPIVTKPITNTETSTTTTTTTKQPISTNTNTNSNSNTKPDVNNLECSFGDVLNGGVNIMDEMIVNITLNCIENKIFLDIIYFDFNYNRFGLVFNNYVFGNSLIYTNGKQSERERDIKLYSYDINGRNINDIIYNMNNNWIEIESVIDSNGIWIRYEQNLDKTQWNKNINEIEFRYAIGDTMFLQYHIYKSQQTYNIYLSDNNNNNNNNVGIICNDESMCSETNNMYLNTFNSIFCANKNENIVEVM